MKKWLWLAGTLIFVVFVAMNEVSMELTEADREALDKFGRLTNVDHLNNVEKAMVLIEQMEILIRRDYAIPKRQTREPADLIRYRTGGGYDWGRTAYKFFSMHNIPCRIVSLYQTEGGLLSLLRPGISSYAGLEILHEEKWVFIDPFRVWAAEKEDGAYGSASDLNDRGIQWKSPLPQELHEFRKEKLLPVYGLLSRHGQFYPPYSPVPDYNWSEFKANFQ